MMAWPVSVWMKEMLAKPEASRWWREVGVRQLFRTVAAFQPGRSRRMSFLDALSRVM